MLGAVGADEIATLWSSRAGRVLVASVGAILLATVIGLAVFWPAASKSDPATATLAATVTSVRDEPCPSFGDDQAPQTCRSIVVDPAGSAAPASIDLGPAEGGLDVERGDRVRISPIPEVEGVPEAATAAPYSLVGLDRTRPLTIAALLLAVLAVVALRLRGLLALAGVGLSLLLLAAFLVPAILAGSPPILVALIGALAVMFVTVVLTNGIGAQALAGALGISLTLVFTTLVGLAAVRFTGLDGSGSELSIVLAQATSGVSLEGVLLAGMVIGGLGVLADTAVTQASAVMALRHAAPASTARDLYRRAVIVGRDHLSATIHTLVLAYAGATLPLLLVLNAGGTSPADTLNTTDIAEPILATIIGCAGLIVAVPLSTALAALLVARIPVDRLPEAEHGHHH
ncbi:MAG: YibE/F family protein [Solirubrobacteraceae bacterium]|nr:YibE/F family protein [Solirubrobacteraceae bacterium]